MAFIGYNAGRKAIGYLEEKGLLDKAYGIARKAYETFAPGYSWKDIRRNILPAIIAGALLYPYVSAFNNFMTDGEAYPLLNMASSIGVGYVTASNAMKYGGKATRQVKEKIGNLQD